MNLRRKTVCVLGTMHAPFVKHNLLALHVADGIRHEKRALKPIFDDGRGDRLRAVGLGVEEVDAAAFGCEGHVAVVADV